MVFGIFTVDKGRGRSIRGKDVVTELKTVVTVQSNCKGITEHFTVVDPACGIRN